MHHPAGRADIEPEAIDDLITVRDWLRYGTSRFSRNGLVYGHGTANALDEAAFLILSALDLPIDELEPWLEARLTRSERMGVADLLQRRITTRKPAAYLTRTAWIRGRSFYVDERVIVPRSYIGELLDDRLAGVVADANAVTNVLDLCTGSGCLAILAAEAFPNAAVDAVDISPEALAVAARNVEDYDLGHRVRLFRGDLFAPLGDKRYDLIIANPPYVTAAAVQAFPAEYRSEPPLAHLGGVDGMDIVRRILAEAPAHLVPGGSLVVEIGSGRDIVEAEQGDRGYLWLDTEQSRGEVLALTVGNGAPGARAGKAAAKPRAPRKGKA